MKRTPIAPDIDAIHKALANPVRREILGWLREPHAHIADQELVTSKRVGQWVFFKRNEPVIQAFLEHMNSKL